MQEWNVQIANDAILSRKASSHSPMCGANDVSVGRPQWSQTKMRTRPHART